MDRIDSIIKDYVDNVDPARRAEAQRKYGLPPDPTKKPTRKASKARAQPVQVEGKRDYKAERELAKIRTTGRVSNLAVARNDQSLGEEYIKLAQALILCSLPHSATKETKITRRARLGDGSTLAVTFSATADGIGMPFGADRKLLFWLLDRAIRNDNPFIPWSSAREYQREVGIEKGGRPNKQLRERFARITGLVISITRKGAARQLDTFPIIAHSYLPNSISEAEDQASLPEMSDRFGVLLHEPLFADIKQHNTVMPRRLWLDIKGPTAVQDLVFWLFYRCYAAASETVIPWTALHEQFPNGDSNPYRLRQHVRKAITLLKVLWPEAQVAEDPNGIWVDRATGPMLDDDPTRNRIRRLKAPA